MFVNIKRIYKASITFYKMMHNLYQRLDSSINSFLLAISIMFTIILVTACHQDKKPEVHNQVQEVQIIPKPKKVLYKRGFFRLDKSSKVLMNLSDEKSKVVGKYLIEALYVKTNLKLKIADVFTTTNVEKTIEISTNSKEAIGSEGFKIIITQNRIKLIANGVNGLFYGSEVVLGLLTYSNNTWQAPQIIIEDQPKLSRRGLYLHFTDSILIDKELIWLLATNRINYLITPQNTPSVSSENIQIISNSNNEKVQKKGIIFSNSIKEFYQNSSNLTDSIIFEINDRNQLHPDSIAIIGQAFWSQTANSDYQGLVNQLKARHTEKMVIHQKLN